MYIIKNKYKIVGDTVILYLDKRNGEQLECFIDLEDLEIISEMNVKWFSFWSKTANTYYAAACQYNGSDGKGRSINGKTLYLHRILMDAKRHEYVDHINHDTLNNRKYNLRLTSNSKNNQHRKGANSNSSTGVRNVNLINKYGGEKEYWVQFQKEGERFKWEFPIDNFEEACIFAEQKRKELFGEFAGNG